MDNRREQNESLERRVENWRHVPNLGPKSYGLVVTNATQKIYRVRETYIKKELVRCSGCLTLLDNAEVRRTLGFGEGAKEQAHTYESARLNGIALH